MYKIEIVPQKYQSEDVLFIQCIVCSRNRYENSFDSLPFLFPVFKGEKFGDTKKRLISFICCNENEAKKLTFRVKDLSDELEGVILDSDEPFAFAKPNNQIIIEKSSSSKEEPLVIRN